MRKECIADRFVIRYDWENTNPIVLKVYPLSTTHHHRHRHRSHHLIANPRTRMHRHITCARTCAPAPGACAHANTARTKCAHECAHFVRTRARVCVHSQPRPFVHTQAPAWARAHTDVSRGHLHTRAPAPRTSADAHFDVCKHTETRTDRTHVFHQAGLLHVATPTRHRPLRHNSSNLTIVAIPNTNHRKIPETPLQCCVPTAFLAWHGRPLS